MLVRGQVNYEFSFECLMARSYWCPCKAKFQKFFVGRDQIAVGLRVTGRCRGSDM